MKTSIAVVANTHKHLVPGALERLKSIALNDGIDLTVLQTANFDRSKDISGNVHSVLSAASFCISLGGDGTLMHASQLCLPYHLPILAINLGSLGFHTQAEYEDLEDALRSVLSGNYTIKEHIVLQATLNNKVVRQAINDVVIAKEMMGHMLHVSLSVNGSFMTNLSADALVICTPFGSTAYNLAAGGPILYPDVHAFSMLAVCPHRPGISPIVLPKDAEILITTQVRQPVEHSHIVIDGQNWTRLAEDCCLRITCSQQCLRLIDLKSDYFKTLRIKLQWGSE